MDENENHGELMLVEIDAEPARCDGCRRTLDRVPEGTIWRIELGGPMLCADCFSERGSERR